MFEMMISSLKVSEGKPVIYHELLCMLLAESSLFNRTGNQCTSV